MIDDIPSQPLTLQQMIEVIYAADQSPESIQIIANPHRMTEMTLGEQKWRSAAQFFGSTVARLWSWDFDHYYFRIKPICQCVFKTNDGFTKRCTKDAVGRIGETIYLCREHMRLV